MAEPAPSDTTTQTDRSLVREYYIENNFFTSVEGVLKVLSIVLCAASAALWPLGGGCAGGAAAAAAGLLLALLCAADALRLAARAPLTCFYTVSVPTPPAP
ncbi:jg27504 [Pararge aegeria aegeria]|uniref:Jg27504 protein n=1 Tax=Pararge aegeria aegeria TaxID=348720 RepID=A0A8S4SJ92_9NEOP|nr:jg27504 [Pararge aegeria aegeria]